MNELKQDYCKKMKSFLQLKRYSQNTIDSYEAVVYNFLEWIKVPPSKVSNKDFSNYILSKDFKTGSSQNRYVSALKIFYYKVLRRKQKLPEFERPRKTRSLPVVVDKKIMLESISKIENLKHRAILSLAYSTGMRKCEIRALKIEHIDSNRMLILIKNSKGSKDRYVKLTEKILTLLREYYLEYKPNDYIFEGANGRQYSDGSLGKISIKHFGVSFHKIRHSNATALLEAGTDIRIIQKSLGHSSVKTTEIYTHVSNDVLQHVQTPI